MLGLWVNFVVPLIDVGWVEITLDCCLLTCCILFVLVALLLCFVLLCLVCCLL